MLDDNPINKLDFYSQTLLDDSNLFSGQGQSQGRSIKLARIATLNHDLARPQIFKRSSVQGVQEKEFNLNTPLYNKKRQISPSFCTPKANLNNLNIPTKNLKSKSLPLAASDCKKINDENETDSFEKFNKSSGMGQSGQDEPDEIV